MPRRRSSSSGRDVTIREGTGEKHWYIIAGYVAFATIGVIYIGGSAYYLGGTAGGVAAGLVIVGLFLGGLVSFISLFKDSAYLRGGRHSWRPRWWYYIAVPVLIGAIGFVGGEAVGLGARGGMTAAVIGFGPAALISNLVYLYRRHKRIGVP